MKSKSFLFFVLAIIVVRCANSADVKEWTVSVEKNGLRKATTFAIAITPDGGALSELSIQCQPDTDGAITLTYTITGPDKIKTFPWNDFEGPDAPALNKKLGKIQVHSTSGTVTIQKALSGSYRNADAFTFSFSSPNHQKNDVTQLLDKVIQGAGTITFCVSDSQGSPKTVCSDFPARKASEPISQTVKPCY